MQWRFLLFFAVFLCLLGGGHLYVVKRLIADAVLPERWRRAIVVGGVVVFALPASAFLFGGLFRGEGPVGDVFQGVGFFGLAYFSLVLALVVVRDLGLLLGAGIRRAARLRAPAPTPLENHDRRRFLTSAVHASMVGAPALLVGAGAAEAMGTPGLVRVDVPLPNLPPELDGLTIGQISDLHVGPTIKRGYVENVVARLAEASPDVVAVTGDLVDGSVAYLGQHTEPLKELRGRLGTFFVTGNHEYYSGAEPWLDEVSRLGMTPLLNEGRPIERAGKRLWLGGVTDTSGGDFLDSHRSDPAAAARGARPDDVKLLLAHQPRSVWDAHAAGFDLQISGHTHGGQFLPWNLLVGLAQPYVSGLNLHDERMWVYVSRGTGYWGPPVRLGAPAEVTLLRLVRATPPQG